MTSCGDVTVFQIDQTTGRLSLVRNAYVTDLHNNPLNYFPVPANPVDFALTGGGGYLLTLTGTTTPTSFPYTGGALIWPYSYVSTSGQLQLSLSGIDQLNSGGNPVTEGTAIVSTNGPIYILDNESVTIGSGSSFNPGTYPGGQILPFSVTTGGSLQIAPGGVIPDAESLANPIQALLESKTKYLYVANQGNNISGNGNNPGSGIAGYVINTAPTFQLTFTAPDTFGSGSGPQCIVEGPLGPVHLRSEPVQQQRHRAHRRSQLRKSEPSAHHRCLSARWPSHVVLYRWADELRYPAPGRIQKQAHVS